MKKNIISILSVVFMVCLCSGLIACGTNDTKVDEYEKQGYLVSVKYDANGGNFLNIEDRYVLDMFKPNLYTKDANGNVKIKLLEPTDSSRGKDITLTRSGYFYAGWYKNRQLVKNDKGEVLDDKGVVLYENANDGRYYYDEEYEKRGYPAYTYSDYWDFEKDVIEYNDQTGKLELVLYAGWVPYYTFTYYYKFEDELSADWKKYGETYFDYKYNQSVNGDLNVCYLPDWSDTAQIDGETVKCGKMNYLHKYAATDNNNFNFPQQDGSTFKAAYSDPEMTKPIDAQYTHLGSIDLQTATSVNSDCAIYVVLQRGEHYKITTAKQLSENGNANGYYELLCDIDFSADANNGVALSWPMIFRNNEFKGSFYGNGHTISNINVDHTTNNKEYGGLFGKISNEAVLNNFTVNNLTFDLSTTGIKLQDAYYGAFAGYIDEKAQVSGITVNNVNMRIYAAIYLGEGFSYNVVANGNINNITVGALKVTLYGEQLMEDMYNYLIDAEKSQVDKDYNVNLVAGGISDDKNAEYIIFSKEA